MTIPTIRMPYLITSVEWSKDEDRFLEQLTKSYTEIALAINNRRIGIFDRFEIVTGEQWYNVVNPSKRRQSYAKVYLFDEILPGVTLPIPHGLETLIQVTRLWGQAITNIVDFRPIPYVSATNVTAQIEINADSTNINIINGATSPTLTSGFVVLEYILTSS